ELDAVETANWFPKIARKDYMVGANLSGSGVDDPDAYFFEHYACGSEGDYTNYCNPELEKMYERQSIEPQQAKRKQLVWEIDRRLQEDGARPMMFNYRLGTCRSSAVHGQQPVQWLAFRGRLARPIAPGLWNFSGCGAVRARPHRDAIYRPLEEGADGSGWRTADRICAPIVVQFHG